MIRKLHEHAEPPYHRPNDPWVEVPRATTLEDENGGFTTVRKRSLRYRRRIFTLSVTAFIVGTLLILGSSPFSNDFFVPGQLTSNHAQILAGQGADRCANCHSNAQGSLTSWIASTIAIGKSKGATQTELCMKCHDKSLNIDFAKNPHNVAPSELARMTAQIKSQPTTSLISFTPPIHNEEIACHACHREHHGANHDLAAMTDAQCQSCHSSNFHSFETDHPDFSNYPLRRRSAIAFDHSSHAIKHFPSNAAKFNCNQCHIDDEYQNVKKLVSYEQGCASCHDQQILESNDRGLAIFSLPMLDMEAINENGLDVGGWPASATGDFDGPLPPLMRVLLLADESAAKALRQFDVDFEFGDIDPSDPEHVKSGVELAWASKRLLNGLTLHGKDEIRSRLQSVLHLEVSESQLKSIVTNLDDIVFQNAARRWLPQLQSEVAENNQTVIVKPNESRLGNLSLQQGEFVWPHNDALYMRIASSTAAQDESQDSDVQAKSELLAINPFKHWTVAGKTDLMFHDPAEEQPESNEQAATEPVKPNVEDAKPELAQPTTSIPQPVAPESRPSIQYVNHGAKASGWYRNDKTFVIFYRPSGHSDDCLQGWMELIANADRRRSHVEVTQLQKRLLSPDSVGACRTCHTIDEDHEDRLNINWSAKFRDPSLRSFTKFSHGAHMIQPELDDCKHCHELDAAVSNFASFYDYHSDAAFSNFKPMTKSNCATCHTSKQTNSGCTQCHNYHVGSRVIGTE